MPSPPALDASDRKIIALLAEDARRSLADIGSVIHLSPSAVNERIRRLVAAGVIKRFTVEASHAALGLDVLAFMWIELLRTADEPRFRAFAAAHPAIAEAHHVTGAWNYLLKVRLPNLASLETFLNQMKHEGFLARSETALALSTTTEKVYVPAEATRPLIPPEPPPAALSPTPPPPTPPPEKQA